MTIATPERTSKDQFDKQAAEYDAQWNEWSKATTDWLLQHAGARPSDRVLDVATGTGFTAFAFAPQVARVVAIDVSGGMLDQARSRASREQIANVAFRVAPAESMPFDDGDFDLVVCRIAAHHFVDVHAFAREAFRVLKPGGKLLIADTAVPDDSPGAACWQNAVEAVRDPSHVRNYSPAEWQGLLTAAGFHVGECTTGGGGITIPLADWIRKAGCSHDQSGSVRDAFQTAPDVARAAFKIVSDADGQASSFTWMRVLIEALKPL